MENHFLVDSDHLSPAALAKKHRLENDPSSRTNHMEYLPGMEIIESDVCHNVMAHVQEYDASIYTGKDVRTALAHDTCSIEDFKALVRHERAFVRYVAVYANEDYVVTKSSDGLHHAMAVRTCRASRRGELLHEALLVAEVVDVSVDGSADLVVVDVLHGYRAVDVGYVHGDFMFAGKHVGRYGYSVASRLWPVVGELHGSVQRGYCHAVDGHVDRI